MVVYYHYDDSISVLGSTKMHRKKGSDQEMESKERESETGEDRENEIYAKETRSDSK